MDSIGCSSGSHIPGHFVQQSAFCNELCLRGRKKITDKDKIFALAQTTVGNLMSGMNEVEIGLENIQSGQTIESQLDVFAGMEF